MAATLCTEPHERASGAVLTPGQVEYFHTFGFLAVPGLLAGSIDQIIAGFEAAANDPTTPRWSTEDAEGPLVACRPVHFDQPRTVMPNIADHNADLAWIWDDVGLMGVAEALLGAYEPISSDGNIMSCSTSWHRDAWEAPTGLDHLKLFLYLDPLDAETGALRVIPGTHRHQGEFSIDALKNLFNPSTIGQRIGVAPQDVPSHAVPTQPGDVVAIDYRALHASFGGGQRRRYIAMDFRAATPESAPATRTATS